MLLFAVVFGLGQDELMVLEPEAIDSKRHAERTQERGAVQI
jgi:hypothetical protein